MQTASTLETELAQFTGSETLYRGNFGRFRFTDGVKYLADRAGAYWLVDAIASYQTARLDDACEGTQFWTLRKNKKGNGAVLTCHKDSNLPDVVTQHIEYTDFPLPEIKLYVAGTGNDRVLMLPSEY